MATRTRCTCRPSRATASRTRIAHGCGSRRSESKSRQTTASGSCRRSSATNRWSRRSGPRHARRHDVIELCRRQLNFADGLIAEEVGELWEDWMQHVDQVLADPQLLAVVYEALARRWTNSRTRGRKG